MRSIGWKTIDRQKTDLFFDKTANGSKISYIALDWQLDCGTVDGVNKSCVVNSHGEIQEKTARKSNRLSLDVFKVATEAQSVKRSGLRSLKRGATELM